MNPATQAKACSASTSEFRNRISSTFAGPGGSVIPGIEMGRRVRPRHVGDQPDDRQERRWRRRPRPRSSRAAPATGRRSTAPAPHASGASHERARSRRRSLANHRHPAPKREGPARAPGLLFGSRSADRPGARAAAAVKQRGAIVLLGLRGGGGVAGSADRGPRPVVELVLAPIGAVRGDGCGVPARLARRDRVERARRDANGLGRRVAAGGGRRGAARTLWQPVGPAPSRPCAGLSRRTGRSASPASGARPASGDDPAARRRAA